jgi:geranylgeranyl pyrophosphate synthase
MTALAPQRRLRHMMGIALSRLPKRPLHRRDRLESDGAAFQMAAEILDAEADEPQLGKRAGKDAARNKAANVSACGLDQARPARDRQYSKRRCQSTERDSAKWATLWAPLCSSQLERITAPEDGRGTFSLEMP